MGENKVSGIPKYDNIPKLSKVIVCTYQQTTFSEAMYSCRPTILLLNKYFELNPINNDLVTLLEESGIIFTDPVLAA